MAKILIRRRENGGNSDGVQLLIYQRASGSAYDNQS